MIDPDDFDTVRALRHLCEDQRELIARLVRQNKVILELNANTIKLIENPTLRLNATRNAEELIKTLSRSA